VTGSTIVNDTRMIEHRVEETAGDVTDAAVFRGWQVVGMFTDSHYAIVTGGTIIHDAGMIKHRRRERRCIVAVRAIAGRGYVRCRFAQGD